MKKFIYFFFLLIFTPFLAFPQWSTDPNNNLVIATGWDPHIASDSAGGCYVTYNYGSFYPQKLAVERLDKYGYKPWADRKQILGELPEQWQAQVIEDEEGGVVVSYDDNQVVGTDFTSRVRVQKIDSSGNFLWGQTGVRVTTEETNHGQGGLVSDGDGGCVIVWQNYDERIFMNRIDRFGQRVWSETGIFLINTGTSINIVRASDGNYYVQVNRNLYRIRYNGEIARSDSVTLGNIVPDQAGGLVLSGKTGSINNIKLVAQRKDSLGNNLWQEPYVEIADSLYINAIIYVNRINTYYFYTWHGRKNGIDLVAQYQALRSDGTKLFNQGSLPISNYPVDALFGDILPSESATFVLIWQDYRSDDGVFGQRRDTLNNALWSVNDILLDTGTFSELHSVTDCEGGAIGLGWNQFDFSISAFKVSKNGILGEVITNINDEYQMTSTKELILYQNFPNPYNSSTTIQFQIPNESKININLYTILGEKVQTIVEGFYSKGIYSASFSSKDLPSGIYIYRLQTETKSITKKLIIIK